MFRWLKLRDRKKHEGIGLIEDGTLRIVLFTTIRNPYERAISEWKYIVMYPFAISYTLLVLYGAPHPASSRAPLPQTNALSPPCRFQLTSLDRSPFASVVRQKQVVRGDK